MITLESIAIIDTDKDKAEKIRRIINKSGIKEIMIINMLCMVGAFNHIKELLIDNSCLKIFHSGNIEMFNKMTEVFEIDQKSREDITYMNELSDKKIVIYYWNYYFEKISALVSTEEGSSGEEI